MDIRNVAIIAHVDHGKTTLVDALLRQSKTHLSKEQTGQDQILDSNELERERGITIFSKNASVIWRGVKINIIDTPGHADFGGEVERVLKMADGALLLVDAKEGPMPQTRFVLKKALEVGLRIIVVINKVDKADARPEWVLGKTFDLFVELGASEDAAFFPVLYAVGKEGRAGITSDIAKMSDITPVFETIVREIPPPVGDPNAPLQMLITTIKGDNYKGRLGTGKIANGKIFANQEVARINHQGEKSIFRLTSLATFTGLGSEQVDSASAGDIVEVSGIDDINIGETITDPINSVALPVLNVTEPTVKVTFMVNDSPFAGREGRFSTSRQIRERLVKELETDMALKIVDTQEGNWDVSGRGELHLAIFIERLRREGYEFQVSQPKVIEKIVDNQIMVPFEEVFIEVPEEFQGVIMQKLGERHGQLLDVRVETGLVYLQFLVPARGLFGYRSEFLTDTKGLGIINTAFYGFKEDLTNWKERDQGSIVAFESGTATLYSLVSAQERGKMFIGPGTLVYKGQVIGQNSREEDILVNVCKEKHQTNMRSKGEGVSAHLDTPQVMELEDALEYIGPDELVEITPKNIRVRKKILDKVEARRESKGLI